MSLTEDSNRGDAREILCIDDSSTTRKLVAFALAEQGYHILEAPDGATGLSLMEQHQPRLVLLDLILPDFDGFELVAPLRSKGGADTTIIAFSSMISNFEEGRLAAAGFDDVVGKPVDPGRLASIVDARLRGNVDGCPFGAGKTVLVVDDDPLQLKLLRISMEQVGFDVLTASDGAEGLSIVRNRDVDAVVADVMMPRCDGFEMAYAIRSSDAHRKIPVLLVTSSYTADADRELAKNSGAVDLVVRTPSLSQVLRALEDALRSPPPNVTPSQSSLDQDRLHRVVSQLERQVLLNSHLSQRCTTLSAELAILSNVSELVLGQRGLDVALDEALAACFDAGSISLGALYLREGDALSVRSIVGAREWDADECDTLFGHPELVERCFRTGQSIQLPSEDIDPAVAEDVLGRSETCSALLIPLTYVGEGLGVLAMFSRTSALSGSTWSSFTRAIANQIAQVLALGAAFEERKRAEKVARERTAFLDAVLEYAPDIVVFVDREGLVRYVSRTSAPDEVIVKDGDLLGLKVGHEAAEMRERLQAVVETGEAQSWEEAYARDDGEEVIYWIKMAPVAQEDSRAGVVVIARDVTEKKATDAKLIVADRMASVGLLAAGVAHEINNPMQALIVNIELAVGELERISEQAPVSPEIVEALVDARDAGDRIRTIVRDLKVFSRVEKERREPVDIPRLLDSTLRVARNEVRQRARVVTRYDGVPPAYGNEARLSQVFLNLVINAAHAIPRGHYEENAITVSAFEQDERLIVEVTDTGEGIPESVRKRIFTPFFTTKPSGVGTGLGLSICQRIVKSLDGELTFESELGRGTTFRVKLPLAPSAETPTSEPEPVVAQARRGKVLVVDDEPIVLRSAERALAMGHSVVGALDAKTALVRLEEDGPFDVLICDLMMPGTNGVELFEEVQRRYPELAERTIFLTGGIFTPWVQTFLRSVPHHRLEKPYDVQVLRVLVDSLIGR